MTECRRHVETVLLMISVRHIFFVKFPHSDTGHRNIEQMVKKNDDEGKTAPTAKLPLVRCNFHSTR
jgi:hypothetical protein